MPKTHLARLTAAAVTAVLVAGSASTAFAQGAPTGAPAQPAAPPAQDGNAAVKLAQQGRVAYDAGRWDEAYDLFAKAQAAASSPMFELYMARSRRNASKLVEARAIYARITQRTLAADAPPAWQQALVDARAELGVLIGQTPSVVVDLAGAPPSTTIRIDARPVRAGETVDVDPGEHVVVAIANGQTIEKRVTVRPGERGVRVALGDGPVSRPPGSGPTSRDEGSRQGSIVPGVVVLAVGGATLAVGAVLGVVALGADSDASSTCPEGRCETQDDLGAAQDDQDAAFGMADVSTVMFIAGGVVTAAGVVLIVVRPGGESSSSEVAIGVRPGGVSVAGAF